MSNAIGKLIGFPPERLKKHAGLTSTHVAEPRPEPLNPPAPELPDKTSIPSSTDPVVQPNPLHHTSQELKDKELRAVWTGRDCDIYPETRKASDPNRSITRSVRRAGLKTRRWLRDHMPVRDPGDIHIPAAPDVPAAAAIVPPAITAPAYSGGGYGRYWGDYVSASRPALAEAVPAVESSHAISFRSGAAIGVGALIAAGLIRFKDRER